MGIAPQKEAGRNRSHEFSVVVVVTPSGGGGDAEYPSKMKMSQVPPKRRQEEIAANWGPKSVVIHSMSFIC